MNYQIFLSDGQPTVNGAAGVLARHNTKPIFNFISDDTVGLTQRLIGVAGSHATDCEANRFVSESHFREGEVIHPTADSNARCSTDLVRFLNEEDLDTATVGQQSVTTYTVGFNLCENNEVLSVGDANLSDGRAGQPVCCIPANHDPVLGCASPERNSAVDYMADLASAGGGQFLLANNAMELADRLSDIIGDILTINATFAAPSIPVNSFNRLSSRDDIYFGLFQPRGEVRWDGNLKKYNLCIEADIDNNGTIDCVIGDVLDANNDPAVVTDVNSTDLGEFSLTATSEWANAGDPPDGQMIRSGGAGGEITDYTQRFIYTEEIDGGSVTKGASLNVDGELRISYSAPALEPKNSVRRIACSDPATTNTGCDDLLTWIAGQDILDDDQDSDVTDTRWWFNDVLHSSPAVITYGLDANDDFIDKVLVGGNAGGLHMIDGQSGEEDWVFMPRAVLGIQEDIFENRGTHAYGIDASPVVHIQDVNNDGEIDSADNDRVRVYFGQRRGGRNMYALDITNATSSNNLLSIPSILWRISATDNLTSSTDIRAVGNYNNLGQTWSEPVLATLRATSGNNVISGGKTVLIFGGGYDSRLDGIDTVNPEDRIFGTVASAGVANIGSGIYVVDPDDGRLIFSVSSASANIIVPDMLYAISSELTVFDSDGDGFEDRIYVGDTAGNVWRVDIGSDIDIANGATSPQGGTVVGRLAQLSDLSGSGVANERRIFYPPSISQVRDTEFSTAPGGEYDYVVVGTGNRANPLNLNTSDRLYALRDVRIAPMQDADSDGIADNYPRDIDGTTSLSRPIQGDVSDLLDASTVLIDSNNASLLQTELGWYIDFDSLGSDGEKVLSATRVFSGTIFVTTFLPTDSVLGTCSGAAGAGRIYNFNLLTANAAIDWDGDGDLTHADRAQQLFSPGIPPEAVPVYTREGITILAGRQNIEQISDNPPVPTYWYQEEQ